MKFYVIIATHARTPLLTRTLRSLAEADRPDGFERVIVIENGSNAGARNACQEVKDLLPIEYRHQEKPGKSIALQSVLDDLKEGFAFFTDDDVRIAGNTLTAYQAAASEHGRDVIYGGPLRVDFEGSPPPQWLTDYLPNSVNGWEPDDPYLSLRWVRFLGANYGIFIERINAVGGFDATLGPGAQRAGTESNPVGQDTEIQNRLMSDGCRLHYVPDALVWHWVPPERCTPKWALHRAYRAAITDALRYEVRNRRAAAGPMLFGKPRWTWKPWLRLATSNAVANLLPDPCGRFLVRLQFQKWRGYQEALRQIAAKNDNASGCD